MTEPTPTDPTPEEATPEKSAPADPSSGRAFSPGAVPSGPEPSENVPPGKSSPTATPADAPSTGVTRPSPVGPSAPVPPTPPTETTNAPPSAAEAASLGTARKGKWAQWSTKTTVAAVVVALALAAGAGGVVYAVTNSDGDSDSHPGDHHRPGKSDEDPIRPGALRAGMYGPLDALHGEFTVKGDDGGYVVKFTQVGVVTEIDSDSLTVKSEDGYTKTYAIDADTAQRAIAERDESGKVEADPSIDKDEKVAVTATVSGDQATADSIAERGDERSGPTRPLPGRPDRLPLPRGDGRR